jgi:predicted Zn-dependent peptidase
VTHQRHQITETGGIRVVTERDDSVRSVAMGVWIDVGSSDEAPADAGAAHFVEHMLFKGNDALSAEDIAMYFDGIGSEANAATGKEHTVVHSRVLAKHVEQTLDVFGTMLLEPAFRADDVEAERDVILQEVAMYEDSPTDVVHELIDALVFHAHPLGRPIAGTKLSVNAASAASLQAFHRQWYTPTRMVVSAVGAVEHDAYVELVERHLVARLQSTERNAATAWPTLSGGRRAAVASKETEQAHIVVAGLGVSRNDPRRYAAALLDVILGGGASSRLFSEIRERRGLAYSVYSYLSQYADTGSVGISASVRPDRTEETLAIMRAELERIGTELVTTEELERARDHVEGRMLLAMESTGVRNGRLGSTLVAGLPVESVESTVERIRDVTQHDVRALAAELFDPAALCFAAVAEDAAAVRDAAIATFGVDESAFAPEAVPA